MIVLVILCIFSLTLFLCTIIIQNPPMRSSPEVVRSQVFTCLRVLKKALHSTSSRYQRWNPRGRPWPRGRPRGHILKSLALASKPQVLENCLVLG